MSKRTVKCAGERRYGGAFTLGPVRYEACDGEPVAFLRVEGLPEPQPACLRCWRELGSEGVKHEVLGPVHEEKGP